MKPLLGAQVLSWPSSASWSRKLARWGAVSALMWSLACHLPVRISDYRGDGTISRVKFFLNPGLKVDFEEFTLASPYKATYRVDGLPKHHSLYHVGLVPALPTSELGQRPEMLATGPVGLLSLRLLDGTGDVIFDCRSSLDKMYWIWRRGEPFGEINAETPRVKTSTFLPDSVGPPPNGPSVLEVTYDPAANAPDVMAKIRISVGGTE